MEKNPTTRHSVGSTGFVIYALDRLYHNIGSYNATQKSLQTETNRSFIVINKEKPPQSPINISQTFFYKEGKMSLTNNKEYNFSREAPRILQFLDNQNLELFSVAEMIQSNNPHNTFIKVYINYPTNEIKAHRPYCPGTNLISGIGDATDNGFWIGMLRRDQIIKEFINLRNFVDWLGQAQNLLSGKCLWQKNSCCGHCKP